MNNKDGFSRDFNINTYFIIGGFLLTFGSSIGSYFKAIGDIRQEIQTTLYKQSQELRADIQSQYATKEETRFIQSSLSEIKSDIKDIKQAVAKR